MSTKAAIEALAAALQRREDRFDVQFLGVSVGTASEWNTYQHEDGEFYILFYNFKRDDKGAMGNIAVDFEAGVYYWFTETEEYLDINYINEMSVVLTALGKL